MNRFVILQQVQSWLSCKLVISPLDNQAKACVLEKCQFSWIILIANHSITRVHRLSRHYPPFFFSLLSGAKGCWNKSLVRFWFPLDGTGSTSNDRETDNNTSTSTTEPAGVRARFDNTMSMCMLPMLSVYGHENLVITRHFFKFKGLLQQSCLDQRGAFFSFYVNL